MDDKDTYVDLRLSKPPGTNLKGTLHYLCSDQIFEDIVK